MHSAEEQAEWSSLEDMDDDALKRELIDARREISDLKVEVERLTNIVDNTPST